MIFYDHFEFRFFDESEQKTIKQEAERAEDLGKLTDEMLQLAYNKSLFHLLVPEALGGHEATLPEALDIFEEASYLDGSFGWTLTLGAGAGIFAAYFEPEFSENVFSNEEAFIAGSGFPAGTAVRVEGGFTISGEWKYISGWPHATLFTASGLVKTSENEEPEIKAFAFLPNEVEILKNWNSFGLKATSSDDIKVSDQFVPKSRTFKIIPEALNYDAPLYRFPFEPFAQCTLAISLAGIAQRFMDESLMLLEQKASSMEESKDILALHKHSARELDKVRKQLYSQVIDCWGYYQKGDAADMEDVQKIAPLSSNLNQTALKACQRIYPHLGMKVLDESNAINRAWRDLHTASQHDFLRPELATD